MLPIPVTFSSAALQEIQHILQHKNIPPAYAVRIGVKGGGGCGGANYIIGFDVPTSKDQSYSLENFTLIIDKGHLMFLLDLLVDFEDGEQARGFTFTKIVAEKP